MSHQPPATHSLTLFGYNQYNQLSLISPSSLPSPHTISASSPQNLESRISAPFAPNNVLSVAAGRFHTLLLDMFGRVQAYGLNKEHQCGYANSTSNGSILSIKTRQEGVFVAKMAAGGSHSIVIDDNGVVFAFGDNTEGTCGVGEDVVAVESPREVRFGDGASEGSESAKDGKKKATYVDGEDETDDDILLNSSTAPHPITQAFCGEYTTFFLEANRRTLWACGLNDSGQLGMGDDVDNMYVPTRVEHLYADLGTDAVTQPPKITKVACGEVHTLILRSDGKVLVSGSNDDGALGNPSSTHFQILSFFVQRNQRIVDIACGSRHSIFLTEQGVAWVCGKNNYNQLGFHGKQNLEIPVRLTEGVRAVYAGSDFSLLHMQQSASKGTTTLMTAGRNKDGELGIPSPNDESSSILRSLTIPGEARLIACGGYHTLILTGPPLPTHPLYISYARHRRIVNRLKAQQTIHIQEMQTEIHLQMEEFNQKQAELQQQYEEKIQQQKLESKQIIDELHQKHHDEKFALKTLYEEKIHNVEQEIQQTVQKMEEEIKANKDQTEAIKLRYESVLSEKESSLATLQNQLISAEKDMSEKLQDSIQGENKRHQAHLEKLQKQYEHMINLLEARLSSQDRQSLSENYRDKYQEEIKEKKRLLDEEYQRQLRKMQQKLDDEYRKNILWLVMLKKQYELSQRELKVVHVRKIKQQEEQIAQLLEGLHMEREKDEIVENERFERLRKQHDTELQTMRTKYEQQLEKQKQLYSKLLKGKNIEPAMAEMTNGSPTKTASLREAQDKIQVLENQLRQMQQQQIAKQFHTMAGGSSPGFITPVKRMSIGGMDSPGTPSSPRVLPRVSLSDTHIAQLVRPPKYTKGDFIGRLAEGNMYNANMDMAVKEMRISSRDKDHMARHVYRLMQLQHPHVLKCYGLDIVEEDALVLCEHCRQSIMEFIVEQDLGLRERITLSMQVFEACMYLVECRMHVNLKLESVLIAPDKNVRLDVIGLTYSAPERHALIYAFGVLLYQLATLRTMLAMDSVTDELSLPESCPANLRALILSCTHQDPSMRPNQLDHIMEQLTQIRNNIFSPMQVSLALHVESFDKRRKKMDLKVNTISNLKYQITSELQLKQSDAASYQFTFWESNQSQWLNVEDLNAISEEQRTSGTVKVKITKVTQ